MERIKRGKVKGIVNTKHVCIWIKKSELDEMQYRCAVSNKKLSQWIVDESLKYPENKEPIYKIPADQDISGVCKSLCVYVQDWEEIGKRANKWGMNISKYLIATALSD